MFGSFCWRPPLSPVFPQFCPLTPRQLFRFQKGHSLHLYCLLYCELRLLLNISIISENLINEALKLISLLYNFNLLYLSQPKASELGYKPFFFNINFFIHRKL